MSETTFLFSVLFCPSIFALRSMLSAAAENNEQDIGTWLVSVSGYHHNLTLSRDNIFKGYVVCNKRYTNF